MTKAPICVERDVAVWLIWHPIPVTLKGSGHENVPMSLADACLVRMAELHEHSEVMTLDSDFTVYRKFRRKVIPLLRPAQ
jgi:hypothetical protein